MDADGDNQEVCMVFTWVTVHRHEYLLIQMSHALDIIEEDEVSVAVGEILLQNLRLLLCRIKSVEELEGAFSSTIGIV